MASDHNAVSLIQERINDRETENPQGLAELATLVKKLAKHKPCALKRINIALRVWGEKFLNSDIHFS